MFNVYAQTSKVIASSFARLPAGLSPFASEHTDSILTPATMMSHSHTFISPTTQTSMFRKNVQASVS